MTLLEGRNLRKTYRLSRSNHVAALRGVNVTIDEGEMVAIMGPSGSGKSTLMHVLGLLHAPDAEHDPAPELHFGGRSVTHVPDRERTRIRATEMGFVFQAFNLVPTLTAAENVALAAEYAGSDRSAAGRPRGPRSNWSGLPTGAAIARPSCQAASSSASRWRGRS
jgi:putative ABC transport system ATP-binding protein